MNCYEINDETIAVLSIGYDRTKIIEKNKEFIVEKKAYSIMDDSCIFYGSTYKGRLSAAKSILNCAYKLPILVEESSKLIFFPTKSSLEDDCCWINFDYIQDIIKDRNNCIIKFNNNREIPINTSKLSIENQIARSTRLSYILSQRVDNIKNH